MIYTSGITDKENLKEEKEKISKLTPLLKDCIGGDIQSKNFINIWIKTESVLGEFFKRKLKNKCKGCKNCCCKSCKSAGGHFSNFDLFIYKLRGLEYPKHQSYITEQGCSLKEDEKSFVCLFYSCVDFPIIHLIRVWWERIVKELNTSNKKNEITTYLYWIDIVLSEIKGKMDIELNKQ